MRIYNANELTGIASEYANVINAIADEQEYWDSVYRECDIECKCTDCEKHWNELARLEKEARKFKVQLSR